MMGLLLRSLLYKAPILHIEEEERSAYDAIIEAFVSTSSTTNISYTLPYRKSRFLYYLTQNDRFILHGSNHLEITTFQPRDQTLFNGQLAKAVFATTDSIWPVYYATFNRSKLKAGMRNGCLEYKGNRYHYYSLSQSTMQQSDIWSDGMIYILPRQVFRRSGTGSVQFDEWISEQPVMPLAKLPVTAEDFYFRHKVSTHQDQESLLTTYFMYKWRTRARKWGEQI